jgi:Ring finger domain
MRKSGKHRKTVTMCGHEFHMRCLNSWEQQQFTTAGASFSTCPLCREVVGMPRRTVIMHVEVGVAAFMPSPDPEVTRKRMHYTQKFIAWLEDVKAQWERE